MHRGSDREPEVDGTDGLTVLRIGTGDAFSAGILRGLLLKETPARTVEFAAATAHLKQSIQGDVNVVTVDEVSRVVDGSVSGRVQR